jgi:hypothetical protein
MHWRGVAAIVVVVAVPGCSSRKSSLLLERQARGPLAIESSVAQPIRWTLAPEEQTNVQRQIEVVARHAQTAYLKELFNDPQLFGEFAGANPYFPEHLVFYVRIANRSGQKIRINPPEFVLLDDLGNQYSTVGVDYITAFAEYRQPFATTTRGVLEEARPGYFGFSLPIGRLFASKPQGRFALLQQASLQPGYIHPGVTYDGLMAFWSPAAGATRVRLLLANVKIDFDANDWPKTVLEFPFEFELTRHDAGAQSPAADAQSPAAAAR